MKHPSPFIPPPYPPNPPPPPPPLPPPHPPNHNPQPIPRPGRQPAPNHNLLLPIQQLYLRPPHERRHQRPQLRDRKPLPDTAPRPVQERQKRVVGTRAPTARLAGREPALGVELGGIGAPEGGAGVHGPGGEDDFRAFRHELAEDGRVDGGVAEGEGDGGVEAQGFRAHGVEVGHVVQNRVVDF